MPQQVGQGATIRLDAQYMDGTGTLVTPTTPRVDILNPSNVEVVTDAVPTASGTGLYYYDYAVSGSAPLGTWKAHWTGVINGVAVAADDYFEVVAAGSIGFTGTYVTRAELRALPNLSDTTKFADAELDAAIAWFEAKFENYTGVAFVPRSRTERHGGEGKATLILDRYPVRSVQSITVYTDATTSTAFTAPELADLVIDTDIGMIRRSSLGHFASGTDNIVVVYTHGHESPPADVKEAAKVAIRDHLLDSNVGNRQFSVQTEQGVVRTSLPGPGRPFGIPFVDDVANARRGAPAIA